MRYRWPGNVRELKNVVERLIMRHHTHREIGPDDLPQEILGASSGESELTAVTPAAARTPAQEMWDRMVVKGESFWAVVYPAFIDRELTKTDLRHLVRAGLQRTQGSYRKLVELFRMAPSDYKRFLAFLYQHDCHLPFHGFRDSRPDDAEIPRSRAL